jgi:hypothetical protein
MKPSDGKLTPKQETALLALLSERTIEAAYESAGVSKATMWRFMQLDVFQTRYRAARRLLVETAVAQLQSDCAIAARVLREVAEDRQAPASSRVAAAKAILEQSIQAVELVDMEERIEKLESLEAARSPENAKERFRA